MSDFSLRNIVRKIYDETELNGRDVVAKEVRDRIPEDRIEDALNQALPTYCADMYRYFRGTSSETPAEPDTPTQPAVAPAADVSGDAARSTPDAPTGQHKTEPAEETTQPKGQAEKPTDLSSRSRKHDAYREARLAAAIENIKDGDRRYALNGQKKVVNFSRVELFAHVGLLRRKGAEVIAKANDLEVVGLQMRDDETVGAFIDRFRRETAAVA